MSEPLGELKPEQCPLLGEKAKLLERYNELARKVRLVEEMIPTLARAHQGFQELLGDLHKLQEEIRLKQYQVGYLGVLQTGKSTALNMILEATEARAPAKEGNNADATTAVANRVRILPLSAPEDTLALCYMREEQYLDKCRKLSEKLEVPLPEPFDQAMLLRTARAQLEQAHADKLPDRAKNLEDLTRLVECGRNPSHAAKLSKTREPHCVSGLSYARRSEFIDRPEPGKRPTPDTAANPLLREVQLGFRSDVVPRELEMIDLPGLDSKYESDTVMTKTYLPGLHGVLLFCRAAVLGGKWITDLMEQDLRRVFKRHPARRIWLVLTRCDELGKHLYPGAPYVKNLLGFLGQWLIKPHQVCFITSTWYNLSDAEIKQILCKHTKGSDPVPAEFAANDQLREAFKALTDRGGIPRLRRLIGTDLKDLVASEVHDDRLADLERLEGRFDSCLQDIRDISAQDPERQRAITDHQTKLAEWLSDVEYRSEYTAQAGIERRDLFSRHARDLEDLLRKEFTERIYTKGEALKLQETPVTLKPQFGHHAEQLDQLLLSRFKACLGELYDAVLAELAALGKLPLPRYPRGAVQAWEEFRTDDLNLNGSWPAPALPRFASSHLFILVPDQRRAATAALPRGGDAPGRGLDGIDYTEMMLEKIKVAVHQAVHAARMRMRTRLLELEGMVNDTSQPRHRHEALPNWPAELDALLPQRGGL